jgi:hypothetical protein
MSGLSEAAIFMASARLSLMASGKGVSACAKRGRHMQITVSSPTHHFLFMSSLLWQEVIINGQQPDESPCKFFLWISYPYHKYAPFLKIDG